mgnify:CR=1 FL=1
MKEFIKKVAEIQRNLKAPKNQFNAFGKYKYRSCEDIMEGLKPILGELVVTVSDDIKMVGDRIYIVATAKITDGETIKLEGKAIKPKAEQSSMKILDLPADNAKTKLRAAWLKG